MIFVTVGTHHAPFDRLVRAVERWAAAHDEPVVVQRGTSSEHTPSCVSHSLMGPDEVERHMAEARVVITHGGPASILLALAHHKVPIVVPRSGRHGEHVDDHQIAFARRMADRVHLCEDPDELARCLDVHEDVASRSNTPDVDRSRTFAEALGRLVDGLLNAHTR